MRSEGRRPGQADEVELRYRCFLGDVVLAVGDFDASARWGWVPVLDFALSLSAICESLNSSTFTALFEFTESEATIRFVRRDAVVVMDPSDVSGSVELPFGELTTSSRNLLVSLLGHLHLLTREELEHVGVTRGMALKWRDFYRHELLRNPNNPSAAGRAELMDAAARLLR